MYPIRWLHRKRFVRTVEPQPDEEFLKAAEIVEDMDLARRIRKVLADMCHIPPVYVRADTDVIEIDLMMQSGFLGGWDELDFLMRLERELGHAILLKSFDLPPTSAKTRSFNNAGQWVARLTKAITPHLRQAS